MRRPPPRAKAFQALPEPSAVNGSGVRAPAHGGEGRRAFVSAKGCFVFFFTACFLCRIKHENIVALEDIYESSNYLYLIMQL